MMGGIAVFAGRQGAGYLRRAQIRGDKKMGHFLSSVEETGGFGAGQCGWQREMSERERRFIGKKDDDGKSSSINVIMKSDCSGFPSKYSNGRQAGPSAPLRAYNPGWLLLARWHMDTWSAAGYESAKIELNRFLENDPTVEDAAEAWQMLAHACYRTGDVLGEVHAFIERAQISSVPFHDISNTANRLNEVLRNHGLAIGKEQKLLLAHRIASALDKRKSEASADDFSRMAWLAIHLGQEVKALEYVESGLEKDPYNYHCRNLAERLGIAR